jgi:hypothetical protein
VSMGNNQRGENGQRLRKTTTNAVIFKPRLFWV